MHDISDQENETIPLWKRLWPILVGIFVALLLASGGYWLGARQATPPEEASSAAVDASAGTASQILASEPYASAATASAAEASGVIFQGAFTPAAALQAIFGETVRKGSESFGRWTQARLPQTEAFDKFQGSGPLLVSSIAVYPVQEAGENRQLILFQSVPEAPAGPAPQGAVIGAAVFRPLGNGWQEVRETRAITAAGAFGQAPMGKPVVLSPTHWGVVFEGSYQTQGETVRYGFLVDQDEQGFRDAGVVFDMGRDNKGSCAADTGVPCFAYIGQLRLSTTQSGGRYLIDHVLKGTRPNADGGLDNVIEVRQYRYQGGRYTEDPSKHVLKLRPQPTATTASPASAAPAASAAQ